MQDKHLEEGKAGNGVPDTHQVILAKDYGLGSVQSVVLAKKIHPVQNGIAEFVVWNHSSEGAGLFRSTCTSGYYTRDLAKAVAEYNRRGIQEENVS